MSIRPETDNYSGCSLSQEVAGHKMKKATLEPGKYLWNINRSLVPTEIKYKCNVARWNTENQPMLKKNKKEKSQTYLLCTVSAISNALGFL